MRPALGFPILIVILISAVFWGFGTGIKNKITLTIKIRNATSIHGVSTYAKKRAAPGCL